MLSPGARTWLKRLRSSACLHTFVSCGQDTLNAEQFGAGPGSCIMELNITCCLHQGGNISDLFEPGKNASYWYGTCLAQIHGEANLLELPVTSGRGTSPFWNAQMKASRATKSAKKPSGFALASMKGSIVSRGWGRQ